MNTDENRSSQTFIRLHPCASVAHINLGGLASDPLPGLTAIVTGGSPALTVVYYDVAYSRNYNPPAKTTGNGLAASRCTPSGPPSGTTTEYEEGQTSKNLYTAWSDKHPAYASVASGIGPSALDVFYAPEINSNVIGLPGVKTPTGISCARVRDPKADLTAWTNSFDNIQCYDEAERHPQPDRWQGPPRHRNHEGPPPSSA